jgi:DNA polymerase III sliding clamp (beta) subunit (PCNA family)
MDAEDYDFSKTASETIPLQESNTPEGFAIGMKASALLDVIGTMRTDNIILNMSDPGCAVTVNEEDRQSHLLALVMPMLLSQN